MSQIGPFLSGAAALGFLICVLFFARFWARTREPLFMAFGVSFLLLAINQTVVVLADIPEEHKSWTYLLKAAAFLILIGAVIRKNIGRR